MHSHMCMPSAVCHRRCGDEDARRWWLVSRLGCSGANVCTACTHARAGSRSRSRSRSLVRRGRGLLLRNGPRPRRGDARDGPCKPDGGPGRYLSSVECCPFRVSVDCRRCSPGHPRQAAANSSKQPLAVPRSSGSLPGVDTSAAWLQHGVRRPHRRHGAQNARPPNTEPAAMRCAAVTDWWRARGLL